MLLALLFTALLFYNPTVAGLVLLVFIPTVWFYYSAVRKRLHPLRRTGERSPAREGPHGRETFRGYADLEINDAFPSTGCAASTGRWTRSLRFSPEI